MPSLPARWIRILLSLLSLDKFAEPEDVAAVIYYLAVDLPAYVNGEVFDINNGAQRI